MESTFERHTGRLDRHVRRSFLRIGEGVSRHRIAYSLEEALRLAALPGEQEGRVYCFRRVSLSGIPGDANRRVWMEQVQQVLGALAAQAVHAGDPRASAANAVYFDNIEEALETLLRNAVRATGSARWAKSEWFASSIIGAEPASSYSRQIPAIVERLRSPSMAPAAAASILFAALGNADPVPLLAAIPDASIREWVRELDGQRSLSAYAPPVQLPSDMKTALQRAASHFGWMDLATVWLAAQAVLSLSPSTLSAGTVVKRSRATLRILEKEHLLEPHDRTAVKISEAAPAQLVFDEDYESAEPDKSLLGVETVGPAPRDEANLSVVRAKAGEEIAFDQTPDTQETSARAALPAKRLPILGEATQSAGLYFLLNVLASLGIVRALDASPALAEAGLATYIMRQLATDAGVSGDDPILLCLQSAQPAFTLPEEFLANLTLQSEAWPKGFKASRSTSFDGAYFLRVWTVATRRWLWRMGRLRVSEVVNRSGRVWLTRTDLDITFPLAAADLRIRRIGLDIDPGWLPWFGECGRVVRFHYRDREPEERA
jgi:hypothetical protein